MQTRTVNHIRKEFHTPERHSEDHDADSPGFGATLLLLAVVVVCVIVSRKQ